jgi:hypothetical protein
VRKAIASACWRATVPATRCCCSPARAPTHKVAKHALKSDATLKARAVDLQSRGQSQNR